MYRDSITHQPIPVSPKSAQTILVALVAAHNAGFITDTQYCMTYAEVVEPGRYPQLFGGGYMSPQRMERWTSAESYSDFEGER